MVHGMFGGCLVVSAGGPAPGPTSGVGFGMRLLLISIWVIVGGLWWKLPGSW